MEIPRFRPHNLNILNRDFRTMFSQSSEPVQLQRDCEVIIIPTGDPVTLPAGSSGYITQALGGSFTVYVEGNLFRVSGSDADALGKEPVPPPQLPDNATESDVESLVWDQMSTCFDPEIPFNIVDLGLIYRCDIEKESDGRRRVEVDMTLTAPGCGMGEILVEDVREKIELIPTISEARVFLVFDPPWNQMMMSEAARLEMGMF